VAYFKPIGILAGFVSAAEKNSGTLSKEEALKMIGAKESDDKCERSGIFTEDDRLINTGKIQPCITVSDDIPARIASRFLSEPSPTGVFKMASDTPMRLEVIADESLRSKTVQKTLIFDIEASSPSIYFIGLHQDDLNNQFAGKMTGVAQISLPGRPKQTVIATSRGCIAVDVP